MRGKRDSGVEYNFNILILKVNNWYARNDGKVVISDHYNGEISPVSYRLRGSQHHKINGTSMLQS